MDEKYQGRQQKKEKNMRDMLGKRNHSQKVQNSYIHFLKATTERFSGKWY